ncbi:MAG: response regulator [Methylococcus sp.]
MLAVDDNRINLMVIERALQQEGACVTRAENGQQALDRLRAAPEDFDVVLMDIQMPIMDGLTATRAIREDPVLASLPVVALSAGALVEEREAAFRAGVNDFMAKPMKIKDMKVVLKPYLKAGSVA